MTFTQVVKTSVTTTDNSPSQDYTHLDNQTGFSKETTSTEKTFMWKISTFGFVNFLFLILQIISSSCLSL